MSWTLLILAVLALAVLEKYWAPMVLKVLQCRGSCDRLCAEPGEEIIWSATVENHSRLPIPFVRLWQSFPVRARVHGDEKWIRSHYHEGVNQWQVEERMSLMGWQSVTRQVRFSFDRRGVYRLGSHRLAAGDLLGFSEKSRDGKGESIVIIPARTQNRNAVMALGGFLGDISVRRFILEDPILTVGFRDYTGREPLKSVSWTRTAMAGSLQVKQYDHTAEQTVTVLLNTAVGNEEQMEECFRLMRTVCEELERKKIPFSMRTNGNLPGPVGKIFHMPEGLGGSHLDTILYALGRADHTCYYTFRNLVKQTLRQRRNNESYIVVTPDMDDETWAAVRELEAASASPVCVLRAEVDQ